MVTDVRGAARELGVSTKTVERMIAAGTLPSIKLGRLRRIRRAALEEFITSRETQRLQPAAPGRTIEGAA